MCSSKRDTAPRTCKLCGNVFLPRKDSVAKGKGLYCGPVCSRKAKGLPRVERACERCGKSFVVKQADVEKGKGRFCSRVCHAKSPKRPKVQRACQWCGSTFFVHQCAIDQGGGLFCSNKCSQKASRVPRLERSCKQCGKEFLAKQNQLDRGKALFCSKECSTESQKTPPPVNVCGCCGKVFVDPGRAKRKYCSAACYQEDRPKGVKPPARIGHEKWALAVVLRDKKCVRCGALENLQAHHLKAWKQYPELRHDVSNGVALCPLCHHAQHPYLPLEGFLESGGKTVQYCVVCETAFLVRRKTQRVCSRKCGWKRKKMLLGVG